MNDLKFISVGYGYIICANRVWSVMRNNASRTSKRCQSDAKKSGRYLDYTFGHKSRTLIMLDNGFVIGCVFSPQVLYNRLNATPAFTSASRSVYGNDGRDRRQMDNGEELSEEDLLRLRQDERVFTPHFTFLEDEEFDDGEEDGEDSCEEEEEEESDEDR